MLFQFVEKKHDFLGIALFDIKYNGILLQNAGLTWCLQQNLPTNAKMTDEIFKV